MAAVGDLWQDHVTAAELTGYARASLADRPENALVWSQWMPDKPVDDLTYKFNQGDKAGLTEAASFRSYDAEPRFGRREGIAETMGELPAIGEQYLLGEYAQLRLRNATQSVRDLLLRDAERIAKAVDMRMEFARAQAVVEGQVTIAEAGVIATVNFGRSGTHSVTSAVDWSDPEALILDELQAWRDVYVATNGVAPGAAWTSTQVRSWMLRNDQIRGYILPVGSTVAQVRVSDLNAVLGDFDLPPITTYDAQGVDALRVSRRLVPADKFLFLPPAGIGLGSTLYGTTLESQEPDYGIAAAEFPGLVVGAFKTKATPIHVNTVGSGIGLPILQDADLTFVADVIA